MYHESQDQLLDLTSAQTKAETLLQNPADPAALAQMRRHTNARIGVGRSGPRLNTRTLLTLRADHAAARDAVAKGVDPALLEEWGLFTAQTCCQDKEEYLTRPDHGRVLCAQAAKDIAQNCLHDIDVQIYASDGLSSTAINANLSSILPVLQQGLAAKGLRVGTPFFVKYGRVATMDQVSELLNATVTCVLIGERPGLASAESMSAYIAYRATVGMPESRRTVVSNIHAGGINALEAGAYICDIIEQMLQAKASGVELKK